ncbi:FAD-dependent monooxygenase [Streptomyces sp. RS10V-4]|uniref:FAD-dependent monooxygenase n=1 Tax=Streptomyces rhizoryzae TaxID=2932493 RepID=UPI0020051009|nr:FAD-dependent monooxygenase [Streptomyces rhizoryzae]MCK7627410.1 FAD-dependent monooxygenase [Streptomyces rhizoryzae]
MIVVGARPTGPMPAGELRLAGVRPLVPERHPRRRDTPEAGGLGGQILPPGVGQDDASVVVDVRGPDGPYRLTARYLAGCDGARSRARDGAGIPFPGTTCPEVYRLAQVTVTDPVTVLDNGDLDVPGSGLIRAGFTRTDRGLFGLGASPDSPAVSLCTVEDETTEYDDAPMTVTELQDSIRRVLGAARGRAASALAVHLPGPAGRALPRRPDAHIAWAAAVDEPAGSAAPALREALAARFGTPWPRPGRSPRPDGTNKVPARPCG